MISICNLTQQTAKTRNANKENPKASSLSGDTLTQERMLA